MGCPNCGSQISYDKRFALLTVCDYCHSAIIFDEKAALIAGEMAVLAAPSGPFSIDAEVRIKGHAYTVIGRVRYGYEQGAWDEWLLTDPTGQSHWLTEDEKRFMLERVTKIDLDKTALQSLRPGQAIEMGDKRFSVREIGTATCEGGEGQLPFRIITGEKVFFLDLLNEDGSTATIECEPDGQVKIYEGEAIAPDDIVVEREGKRSTASFEQTEGRERISYDASRNITIKCHNCGGSNPDLSLTNEHAECSHCGTSLEVPAKAVDCPKCGACVNCMSEEAKSAMCEYCGSQINLQKSEPTLVVQLKDKYTKRLAQIPLPINLGHKAIFDDLEFQFVGYYCSVEEYSYFTHEYLFYNKDWGYRWLSGYQGHYTLETEKMPTSPDILIDTLEEKRPRSRLSALGKSWSVFEKGECEVCWVEGELPWVAKKGDLSYYVDLIRPPYILSCEYTNTEIEWAQAKYIDHDELAKALAIDKSDIIKAIGVGAAQVNKNKAYMLATAFIAFCFAVLASLLLVAAISKRSECILDVKLKNKDYANEYLSPEFEAKKDNLTYQVVTNSAVDNSWVYLNMAIVDTKEMGLLDMSSEVSYYHGVEGGESWREGSREDSSYFKIKKAGTYRLLVQGETGTGETAGDINRGPDVKIKIYENVTMPHFYIFSALFCAAIAAVHLFMLFAFEGRRWKHLTED